MTEIETPAAPERKTSRAKWIGCSVILISFVLGFGLCEIGLRLFRSERVLTLPHRFYHHTRPANWRGVWTSDQGEFSTRASFNSLGLRGSEPDLSAPRRMVFLGDSMIEALQVPEEETVTALLSRGLGDGVEVVNAGVGGYSPILCWIRLKDLIVEIKPEKVLLALFPNDLEEEAVYWRGAVINPRGEIIAVPAPVYASLRGRIIAKLFEKFAFWRLLQRSITPDPEAAREPIDPDRPPKEILYPFRRSWTDQEREVWRQISESLGEIRRLCRKNGAEVIVVIVPPGHQTGPDAWKSGKQAMGYGPEDWIRTRTFQEEVRARAQRLGIEVIDLLSAFRSHPAPAELYFDYDGHWTAKGHRLASEVILGFLNEPNGGGTTDGGEPGAIGRGNLAPTD